MRMLTKHLFAAAGLALLTPSAVQAAMDTTAAGPFAGTYSATPGCRTDDLRFYEQVLPGYGLPSRMIDFQGRAGPIDRAALKGDTLEISIVVPVDDQHEMGIRYSFVTNAKDGSLTHVDTTDGADRRVKYFKCTAAG